MKPAKTITLKRTDFTKLKYWALGGIEMEIGLTVGHDHPDAIAKVKRLEKLTEHVKQLGRKPGKSQ